MASFDPKLTHREVPLARNYDKETVSRIGARTFDSDPIQEKSGGISKYVKHFLSNLKKAKISPASIRKTVTELTQKRYTIKKRIFKGSHYASC